MTNGKAVENAERHGDLWNGASVAMPPGMAVRYDMPAPDLTTWITGYNIYRSDDPAERDDWFLPAPAMLCVSVRAGPIDAQIGNRRFVPMPQASIIGPSSSALRSTTRGGIMVGVGISACGWARLGLSPANLVHNRIVPADALLGTEAVGRLVRALEAVPDDTLFAATLDRILRPLLIHDDDHLACIAALARLSVTDGVIKAGEVAETLGIAPSALLRLSQRYFGLTPKLLLRRARFLRSFMQMFLADAAGRTGAIDSSYHDMSHYLRDANTFLGTTPRRFMQIVTPVLRASIRARAIALGAPTQALHDGSTIGAGSAVVPDRVRNDGGIAQADAVSSVG